MDILKLAEDEVKALMDSFGEAFSYHNMSHAMQVRQAAHDIASHEGVDDEGRLALELAALFHDVGYDKGAFGHEVRGAELCRSFLVGLGAMRLSEVVPGLILSTQSGVTPQGQLEQVLCDADLSYLGTDEYAIRADLLRKEMFATRNRVFTEEEWIRFNLGFFRSHRYLTNGAQSLFAQKKKENESALEKQLMLYSQ